MVQEHPHRGGRGRAVAPGDQPRAAAGLHARRHHAQRDGVLAAGEGRPPPRRGARRQPRPAAGGGPGLQDGEPHRAAQGLS